MGGVTVRPAEPRGMGRGAAIWNHYIRETDATFTTVEKDAGALAEGLPEVPCFLVAERAGALTGFALYDRFRKGPGYDRTMELTLYVAPEARGSGTGGALMTALVDHARAAGLLALVAAITGSNDGSIRFHERHGFVTEGRLGGVGTKWGRVHDLVLMVRRP